MQETNVIAKEFKEKIELFIHIFTLLSKFGIFCGLLITFSYISLLQFLPQGLTVSDTLIFVFAFLGFSIFLTLGIFTFAGNLLWIFGILDAIQAKRIERWERRGSPADSDPKGLRLKIIFRSRALLILSFILFSYMIFSLLDIHQNISNKLSSEFDEILGIVFGFSIAGFFIILFFGHEKQTSNSTFISSNVWIEKLFLFLIVIALFLIFGNPKLTLKGSMMITGLYQKNVPVELTQGNYKRLKSIAINMNVNIASCLLHGSENYIVSGVDVMWHGIGNRALLQINNLEEKNSASKGVVSVEMDDAGVWIVHSKLRPATCALTR